MENTRDSSQLVIWEFHQQKFQAWEAGRVNIPQHEEYKVRREESLTATELTVIL